MTRQPLDVLAEALAITEVGCWFGPRPMQPADDAASHRHHAEAILAALADQGYGIGELDAAWSDHPGEPHEFRTVCRRCGEPGRLHVSLITDHERVDITTLRGADHAE